MYKAICSQCLYEKEVSKVDISLYETEEGCPLCGANMQLKLIQDDISIVKDKNEKSKQEHIKKHIDEILVENMIGFIKEQGEVLVWKSLNETKLEYRLDDLTCFFEAKYRLQKEE